MLIELKFCGSFNCLNLEFKQSQLDQFTISGLVDFVFQKNFPSLASLFALIRTLIQNCAAIINPQKRTCSLNIRSTRSEAENYCHCRSRTRER